MLPGGAGIAGRLESCWNENRQTKNEPETRRGSRRRSSAPLRVHRVKMSNKMKSVFLKTDTFMEKSKCLHFGVISSALSLLGLIFCFCVNVLNSGGVFI